MKRLIPLISLLGIISVVNAYHYPFCDENHLSGSSNCWAYAMALTFNGNPQCTNTNLGDDYNTLPSTWFTKYNGWNIDLIQVGDIIYWGDHAAYVSEIDNVEERYTDNITVKHKHGPGKPTQETTLDVVIATCAAVNGNDPSGHGRLRPNWGFTLQNSFTILVSEDSVHRSGSPLYKSPKIFGNFHWHSSHTLIANYDGALFSNYKWKLHKWEKNEAYYDSTASTNIKLIQKNTSEDPTYTAFYKKLFSLTITTEYPSIINEVIVDGVTESAGTQVDVIEDRETTIEAFNNQVSNGLEYRFDAWKKGTTIQSTNKIWTFYPTEDATYTAHYTPYPTQVHNVDEDGTFGNPIHLTWNEHSNTNVNYKIYRKRQNLITHVTYGPELAGSVNHGTTQWSDPDYSHIRNPDYLLEYDVRAYYTLEGTYADENWAVSSYGGIAFREAAYGNQDIPKDYNLSAAPNPFNPATTIHYSLPEASYTTMTVYDMLGREIIQLIDEQLPSGNYNHRWSGLDRSGKKLSSGMYICRISANSTKSDKRFVQTLKLILLE